jgi:hypothetical protein
MPNYSRSHLGRFIRKMFATEIERELRMLEEYVLADAPSDDVGESLMVRDADFEPPEVPFQPKPTSVSVALPATDFSGDSNFTTMPKEERVDIHVENTHILPDKGRNAPRMPSPHVVPRSSVQMAAQRPPTSAQMPAQPRPATQMAAQPRPPSQMTGQARAKAPTQPPPSRARPPTQQPPARAPRAPTMPPPIPPQARRGSTIAPAVKPIFDEDLHAAPTMIIDINKMKRRRPG